MLAMCAPGYGKKYGLGDEQMREVLACIVFFFNYTATTEIYTSIDTLSLHDALPIFDHLASLLHPPAAAQNAVRDRVEDRSEEHTSELQSPIDISYAVFCLKKKK